jgi:hypothetical protein
MGIPNVEWKIVMRPSAFWVATDIWPCAYNTVMCTIPGNATQFVDAAAQRAMSNEMRNGNFLWIDGERFEVILDNFIPETQPVGGVFESDIYFLPFTAMGIPVLYWQYFDEGNAEIAAALNRFGMGDGVFSTDDGAYIVWTKRNNLCIQWQAKTQPRLRLDTPFLAGRLNNARYYPLQHERDADPAGPYYANGGLTYRSGPSLYQPGAA